MSPASSSERCLLLSYSSPTSLPLTFSSFCLLISSLLAPKALIALCACDSCKQQNNRQYIPISSQFDKAGLCSSARSQRSQQARQIQYNHVDSTQSQRPWTCHRRSRSQKLALCETGRSTQNQRIAKPWSLVLPQCCTAVLAAHARILPLPLPSSRPSR